MTRPQLIAVEGHKLTFRVEADDEVERICEGEHKRVIIDLERFEERIEVKRGR